jgi:flavin-binding protein dodecin
MTEMAGGRVPEMVRTWPIALRRRGGAFTVKRNGTRQGGPMTGHVYRVTEIVGSSPESIDQAVRNAVARAKQTLRNLDWFEVTEIRGHIEDEEIGHFQVTVKVGFRLDDAE